MSDFYPMTFGVLLVFFLILGVVTPLIANDMGFSTPSYDVDGNIVNEDVSGLDIASSVLTVAFWSFEVPIWINIIILLPMRLLFYLSVYRVINPLA